jgi:hypothetical protein
MKQLRCCGPRCSILSKETRLEYELELLAGRCLCREAVERMDRHRLAVAGAVRQFPASTVLSSPSSEPPLASAE